MLHVIIYPISFLLKAFAIWRKPFTCWDASDIRIATLRRYSQRYKQSLTRMIALTVTHITVLGNSNSGIWLRQLYIEAANTPISTQVILHDIGEIANEELSIGWARKVNLLVSGEIRLRLELGVESNGLLFAMTNFNKLNSTIIRMVDLSVDHHHQCQVILLQREKLQMRSSQLVERGNGTCWTVARSGLRLECGC